MSETNAKKKLLLHSCCGPCSTAVLERLLPDYEITLFYYNPNITDPAEYEHRLSEQERFLAEWAGKDGRADVKLQPGDYDPQVYYNFVEGLEQEPEGGARCAKCFMLRLRETAEKAAKEGYDCFDSTLTVSPYKNYKTISPIGFELAEEYGVEYLDGNYKKKDGYLRSIALAKEYGLYRQHYCGCEFSKWDGCEDAGKSDKSDKKETAE